MSGPWKLVIIRISQLTGFVKPPLATKMSGRPPLRVFDGKGVWGIRRISEDGFWWKR